MSDTEVVERTSTHCPVQESSNDSEHIAMSAEWVIPKHKRMFVSYLLGESGERELHLSFGEQDIVFDDPGLFAFGEGLASHARFSGADAARWAKGCDWTRVRDLLEALMEAGLIQSAEREEPTAPRAAGPVASPLPPSNCATPRTWVECEALTRELTGHELALGHLELVVPVYRIAHPVLDQEGRQVGEANVFPAPLRLDVATEWRICLQPGSRFEDEQPMNVSALRSMLKHWKPAMALLAHLRDAYLVRCPRAHAGWTVGHIQRLTTLVLALPAHMMMVRGQALANGELDPVLSSLFRVTDGVRMVMHRMLFTDDNEASRTAASLLTAADVYAYAERNTAFLSDHGVCAGPRLMIEEFLGVLFGSASSADVPTTAFSVQVTGALAELDAAFDYGLFGLQAYAVVFSLWPRMARAYESVAALLDEDAERVPPQFAGLREPVLRSVRFLREASRLRNEQRRCVLEAGYADMYAACGRALGEPLSDDALHLRLADPVPGAARALESLRACVTQLCPQATPAHEAWLDQWCAAVGAYLVDEQRVVRLAEEVQARINLQLGRDPAPPLTARDLALHYRLVAFHFAENELLGAGGRLPYLVDDLEQALRLKVVVNADAVTVAVRIDD